MKFTWTQPTLSLLSIDKTATGSQPGWIESCLASYEIQSDQDNIVEFQSPPFIACRAEGNEYELVGDGSGEPVVTPPASAVAS